MNDDYELRLMDRGQLRMITAVRCHPGDLVMMGKTGSDSKPSIFVEMLSCSGDDYPSISNEITEQLADPRVRHETLVLTVDNCGTLAASIERAITRGSETGWAEPS